MFPAINFNKSAFEYALLWIVCDLMFKYLAQQSWAQTNMPQNMITWAVLGHSQHPTSLHKQTESPKMSKLYFGEIV